MNSCIVQEQFCKSLNGMVVPLSGMTVPLSGTTVPLRYFVKCSGTNEKLFRNTEGIVRDG